MKKTLTISATLIAMLAISADAYGGTSYGLFLFDAKDHQAAPALIGSGTWEVVVDRNRDGLIAPGVDTANTWVWDSNDLLLMSGPIVNGEAQGDTFIAYTGARPAGVDADDPVYLLWFEKPFPSATPGNNTAYGVENLGTMGADPGDYTFWANGGRATQATPAVVPEPSSLAMLLVGAVGIACRRRWAKC